MRLIDAKALETQTKEAFKENPVVMGMLLRWIRKQPTIDAVPVVRCKDCDYSRPLNRKDPFENTFTEGCIWCHKHGDAVFENDFCSYGVRKEGDT